MNMDANRIIAAIFGNVYNNRNNTIEKFKFNSRFYAHIDDNREGDGEVIFCKNNVNVYVYSGKNYLPGYLTLKACSINEDYTRLVLHWTSNIQLKENVGEKDQRPPLENDELFTIENPPAEVFHIDLCDMKTLRFFFEDDGSSGHFVVGNHENHYKVFHFDLGGMNHLEEIFHNWSLCKSVKLPAEEEVRKKCFTVIPIYYIQPNQSLEESRYKPMTKARWLSFFNASGQVEDVANFRKEVFFGGILPEVRSEAWPFLLHYYPFHSRSCERKTIKEEKTKEYSELNEKRLNMPKEKYDKFWLSVQCTVDKDVVRTDRSHPYFSGSDNPNVEIMRKILLNFAWYQPEIGYNQGMSDIVASILCTVQDEVDAFWCFVGLMENSVFVTSPKDTSMDCQLLYLKELLRMMVVKFYAHLLLEDEGMDLLFCHRWLLLGFKREFYDLHVMRMWEASWSHYQTEYFHIFLCVAIVVEYGDEVWQKNMRIDEMLNYFNNMALQMDGDKVLRKARSLLHQFRQLSSIPCTLRGLLSGPGVWDSATLPDIECNCHGVEECKYSVRPCHRTRLLSKLVVQEKQEDKELEENQEIPPENESNPGEKISKDSDEEDDIYLRYDNTSEKYKVNEMDDQDTTSGQEYETCTESSSELVSEIYENDKIECEQNKDEMNKASEEEKVESEISSEDEYDSLTSDNKSDQVTEVELTKELPNEPQIELYESDM